jgi:hypothetical protein
VSFAVLVLSALMALAPPSQEFDRGRVAFGRGEYQRAIQILKPLLYPDVRLETEGEVVQAHRMLGVANLFESRPADAKSEFRKLLELRPDYRFDPLLDPPRVVDFFNGVLKDEEEEIATLEAKRRKQEAELAAQRREEAERLRVASAKVVLYERHSYLMNFVPFGAGQFQNGQRRKGWLFASAEAGLGAISVSAFVVNFAYYGVRPQRHCLTPQNTDVGGLSTPCPMPDVDHSQEDLSRDLLRVQLASGALFFAAAIWGAVDAIRHYQERELLEGDAIPAGTGPAAARPQAARLRLDPGIPSAPLGFGLAGAF